MSIFQSIQPLVQMPQSCKPLVFNPIMPSIGQMTSNNLSEKDMSLPIS